MHRPPRVTRNLRSDIYRTLLYLPYPSPIPPLPPSPNAALLGRVEGMNHVDVARSDEVVALALSPHGQAIRLIIIALNIGASVPVPPFTSPSRSPRPPSLPPL
jgi:hypothetical protein